jgi:hypothetical protein
MPTLAVGMRMHQESPSGDFFPKSARLCCCRITLGWIHPLLSARNEKIVGSADRSPSQRFVFLVGAAGV